MRLIDADALEREGWKLHRSYQQSENAMAYEMKSIQEIPTAQPELIEKTAYIRGFEQGRTQGMIDSQGGKK